jgi:hypothetical protein
MYHAEVCHDIVSFSERSAAKRHKANNVQEQHQKFPWLNLRRTAQSPKKTLWVNSNLGVSQAEPVVQSVDLDILPNEKIEILNAVRVSNSCQDVVNTPTDEKSTTEWIGQQYFHAPKLVDRTLDFEFPGTWLIKNIVEVAGPLRDKLSDINRLLCDGAYRCLEELIFHICSRIYVNPSKSPSHAEESM